MQKEWQIYTKKAPGIPMDVIGLGKLSFLPKKIKTNVSAAKDFPMTADPNNYRF
jgi:hypothetical protein